jgi:hypothetical protein
MNAFLISLLVLWGLGIVVGLYAIATRKQQRASTFAEISFIVSLRLVLCGWAIYLLAKGA